MAETKSFQESAWWQNAVTNHPAGVPPNRSSATPAQLTAHPSQAQPQIAPHPGQSGPAAMPRPTAHRKYRHEFARYLVDYFCEVLLHMSGGGAPQTPENEAVLRQALRITLNNFPADTPLSREADFEAEFTRVRQHPEEFLDTIIEHTMGFGPIEPFMHDPEVNEIMVNGPNCILIEKREAIIKTSATFASEEQVYHVINRILAPLHKSVDERTPMMDARLPDGSRVTVIIPPVSVIGPALCIRKFPERPLDIADLVRWGSLTEKSAKFLEMCVRGKLNVIVCGGTGTGKTTLLNVLAKFIPDSDRIVTIEDTAELQIGKPDLLPLEARMLNSQGEGEFPIRELLRNALRMRPDRLIVGECRGGEALDMLQAMNTGHEGSMATCHANSPRDMLNRLEIMVLMAGMTIPVESIHRQIASGVQLIIQTERMEDGSRRVNRITEVEGYMDGVVILSDIYLYESTTDENGKMTGKLVPTGVRPKFGKRLAARSIELSGDLFI